MSFNGEDLSLALLRAGLAWHFKKYDRNPILAAAEIEAREGGTGLFSQPDPVPPWSWRQDRLREPTEDPQAPYRGNVKSKVFHATGCRHFLCVNCTRTFQSAEEARLLGYRPHQECFRPNP